MKIETIFKKNIFRPINGVIKADQLDEPSVSQELEEFVVTQEMDRYLRRFFGAFTAALDRGADPDLAIRTGVWVSGFFGSGKSHFIKIVSYLLNNQPHLVGGVPRRAIELFEDKISDPMFLADMKRAAAANTTVILFNIDNKADSRDGRQALLSVFLKVLNEAQGFSPDHPHIAHLERHLEKRGKLKEFHRSFETLAGVSWLRERDAYDFHRDQVAEALSQTTGQSRESAEKWVDKSEENFSLTIENLAKWVLEYLDSKGSDSRIMFLIDEVGQFIGGDTHLMLNLQTITEELGTRCRGRAWVVVTSQEDLDSVLGETTRGNDFSKIQGRFSTRIHLTSQNVDEVLKERLLKKSEAACGDLSRLFKEKGDILKNQLTFRDNGMTLPSLNGEEDFVTSYPVVPYQFKLLQKIFESIRKAGATGLHLAQGERSLLDAFQGALKELSTRELGALIPLYSFYPAIENFLEAVVARTIGDAARNAALEPQDVLVLKVLFLIRYVEEMKGNLDNIVTLCIDEIDMDRLELRRRIEGSLARLEKETLINRVGERYFFLTNEERSIGQEIKNVEVSSAEEAKLMGELVFSEVFGEMRKYRFPDNRVDFSLNRICDHQPFGNRVDADLTVMVVTPLNDNYSSMTNAQLVQDSAKDNGRLIIALPDDDALARELKVYLRTDKYLRTRDSSGLQSSTKRIQAERGAENRDRRMTLVRIIEKLVSEARYFASGSQVSVTGTSADGALAQGLEHLVRNTFNKMGLLKSVYSDEPALLKELQWVVRSDNIGALKLENTESNPPAIAEVREYLNLQPFQREDLTLERLVERYAKRPYGWPKLETALIAARLFALGELHFKQAGAVVPKERAYAVLSDPRQWTSVLVIRKLKPPSDLLKTARDLARSIFSEVAPDTEEPLAQFITEHFALWEQNLKSWRTLAETSRYPGLDVISDALSQVKNILAETDDSGRLFDRFVEQRTQFEELSTTYVDLSNFYEHQRGTWDKLLRALGDFEANSAELERDERSKGPLGELRSIRRDPAPYTQIRKIGPLLEVVCPVNAELLEAARVKAREAVSRARELLNDEVAAAGDGARGLQSRVNEALNSLLSRIDTQASIAHLTQTQTEVDRCVEELLALITKTAEAEARAHGVSEPKVKRLSTVRPGELVQGPFLESPDDIKKFLDTLSATLYEAIARGERVRVR